MFLTFIGLFCFQFKFIDLFCLSLVIIRFVLFLITGWFLTLKQYICWCTVEVIGHTKNDNGSRISITMHILRRCICSNQGQHQTFFFLRQDKLLAHPKNCQLQFTVTFCRNLTITYPSILHHFISLYSSCIFIFLFIIQLLYSC